MKKFLIAISFICAVLTDSSACTGITLKVNNKDVVFARTLEFTKGVFSYDIAMIPRNYKFTGTTPDKKAGLSWKTQYAYIGFVPAGELNMFSGLNEKGLAYNLFYLPGYTEYQKYDPKKADKTLAPIELGAWILGNFSTVKEVRENLNNITVANVVYPPLKFVPPVHFAIIDKTGDSIVVEYIKGKLSIFDNQLGIITNAPNYGWHITNVKNYINLRPQNVSPIKIDGLPIQATGCGSGALGLPGDMTPPSRFIRALFMSVNSTDSKNTDEAVLKSFHILNNFDIAEGMVMNDHNGEWVPEVTQWTCAIDMANLRYFFHLRNNRVIRIIDMKKMDFSSSQIKIYKLPKEETIVDISEKMIKISG